MGTTVNRQSVAAGSTWSRVRQIGARACRWLGNRPYLLALAVALFTRLFRLTWLGLWTDEAFSVFLARTPLRALFIGTANDLHPPLFYLLLKAWMLPGASELSVRLFAVCWGLLTIALLYHIGRRLWEPAVGFWAALFLALSPKHVAYSREARMYVVLVFFLLLSLYMLWRCLEDPFPGSWLAYIASTLAMIYTQNVGLLLLPVEALIAIVLLARRWNTRRALSWLGSQVSLVVGYGPWLPVAAYQTVFHHASWVGKATLTDLRGGFVHVFFGFPRLWGADEYPWQIVAYLWLAVVLVAGIVYIVRRRKGHAGLWAYLSLLLPTALLCTLVTLFPIYQEKQLLVLAAPLALVAGLGAAGLPRVGRAVLLVAFLALAALPLYNIYFCPAGADQPDAEGWRELAAYLEKHARPGDGLVINPGAAVAGLDFYLSAQPDHLGYPMTYDPLIGNFAGEVARPEIVAARLRPFAETHRRIWLVECCVPTFWDPARLIPAWLEEWGVSQPLPTFPGIEVHLYEARRP